MDKLKTSTMQVLMWHLAVKEVSPGDNHNNSGWSESALRLATREQRQAILVKKKWVACFEWVKHVEVLELWLGMTSLELWFGIEDEHEELLSCGSGWRVLPV
ncbi:hypothetical protein DEO72_LG3g605 [Vigna unguiculata]|uniref:Uncharacterized protein n=1 Tax=Vigna unguiculata TaxID=3917 RepID=A0A4D6LCR3_VIGUN|nr:hypothetical protein DEO72_LG3g605 [Vigna unguiculata]